MRNKFNASKKLTVLCSSLMALSLAGCGQHSADFSKVVFEDSSVVYDGTAKTLEIKNVPDVYNYSFDIVDAAGKTVEPSKVVNVGSYLFTANFVATKPSYKIPDPMKATLTITKATYDMSSFSFGGLEHTYDGEAHTPTLTGVPEGVTANVSLYQGDSTEPVESAINVGTYKAVATFTGNENYNTIENKEAFMVINKADYPTSGISITGLSYTYDGRAHLPTVSGLPQGVAASFKIFNADGTTEVASAVNAGTYHVVVSFSGEDSNHNPISSQAVDMVIGKATYDTRNLVYSGLSCVYDGTAHVPAVSDLPAGVTASVKLYSGTQEVAQAVEVGTYKAVFSFTGDANHNDIPSVEKTLTIDKGTYDMSGFAIGGLEVKYDGTAHVPTVSGVPTGVTATAKLFNGNTEITGATEVGSYKVVVSFSGDGVRYNDIANREATLTVSKGTYDMSNFKVEGLNVDYDGQQHTPTLSGVPTGVTATAVMFADDAPTTPLTTVSDAGSYKVVVAFSVDTEKYETIANREATLVISKSSSSETFSDVEVRHQYFNVNDTTSVRKPAVTGDLKGFTPVFAYKDSEGETVTDISKAGVGEYDVKVTFTHPNYETSASFNSKITITDKVVKNISTYAELQAMALEAQAHFGVLKADEKDMAGDIQSWDLYNGGDVANRWSNQVIYQLTADIECPKESWKSAGWDIGMFLSTELRADDKYYVPGTDTVVDFPLSDGAGNWVLGYVNLFFDGNNFAIKNLKLDNNTHPENTFGDQLGQYPQFLNNGQNGSSYRRAGFFNSTSFSTFKNIVFDHPVMNIDDTSATVIWAGFINATEGFANTYEGLQFINPVMNVNGGKNNIGGISGITLGIMVKSGSVRGADCFSDRPEEMITTFKNVSMTDIEWTVNSTGGRSSVGGIYGESQDANRIFNMDNVDLSGEITSTCANAGNVNVGDIFGFADMKYLTGGQYHKDPDPVYVFNMSNCDTAIAYQIPDGAHFGTAIEGNSYHRVALTSETYEASKYYILSNKAFVLATGAFDENEYYFEKGQENEIFESSYVYYKAPNADWAGILNDSFHIENCNSRSGIGSIKASAFKFESKTVEFNGNAHSVAVAVVDEEFPDTCTYTVKYSGNGQTDIGEHYVLADITVKQGLKVVANFTKMAVLTIIPGKIDPSTLISFGNTTKQYNGSYQELNVESAPSWVSTETTNNVRKEIGSQTVYTKVVNTGNPNYTFTTDIVSTTFTIAPYEYDVTTDTDTLIAVATEDKIELTAKNLGFSGTAEVVYFRSYEYFSISDESGVVSTRTDGTVIAGVTYVCGSTQKMVFDRFLPSGLDLVYTKFGLRVGSAGSYELLHSAVYCKDIYSKYGYDYNLSPSIKGIDYPPFDPAYPSNDAADLKANFSTYNILLKDLVYPNEYKDADGNIVSNIDNIPVSETIAHVVNGTTYYMKKAYFENYLDKAVNASKANNTKLIGIFYNWNETDQSLNPYYVTYPDARDPGSMTQFALNTSNELGEGYVIACIDYMMTRYAEATKHVFKDFIIGNELELAQRWYPIQTYQGNDIYPPIKFAAEYVRTLRLANNTIKKYIPDANVYAPFSRYMSPTGISKDYIYTIKSLLDGITHIATLEGDFDYGITIHPYDHSHPTDVVYSATVKAEFDSSFSTEGLTYTNIEVFDKYIHQQQFLYNGTNVRKVILDETGVTANGSTNKKKAETIASLAFIYYRCSILDCIYALCASDYGIYRMFEDARNLWREIDGPNSLTVSAGLYNNLSIFDRTTKTKIAVSSLGISSWEEFMAVIWNNPDYDWSSLWDEAKIIPNP